MADEMLSQEEIEALMSAANSGDAQAEPIAAAEPQAQSEQPAQNDAEPHPVIDMRPKMEQTVRPAEFSPISHAVDSGPKSGIDMILDVSMNVAVELGRTTMRVKDVLGLGPGSVVELNKNAGEPVEVVVNGKVLARGEVVVIDENFGVRITEIVSGKANRTNAKAA